MSIASLSSFDTLAYVKRLKEADVPEKQAEAQAEALRVALNAALDEHASTLATKGDIALVRKDLEIGLLPLRVMMGITLAGVGVVLTKLFLG